MYYNSFKKEKGFDGFKTMKYLMIGGIVLIVLLYLGTAFVGLSKTNKGGHMYMITVDDRNNGTTHIADSILHKTERCVEFRNEFGLIQSECGDRVSILTLK